jgi:hypothetical protein
VGAVHRLTMDDPQFHQHGGPRPSHRPYWKRMHHSPFFWVAACFILIAMTIYVMTGNLSFRPGKKPQPPVPALAP